MESSEMKTLLRHPGTPAQVAKSTGFVPRLPDKDRYKRNVPNVRQQITTAIPNNQNVAYHNGSTEINDRLERLENRLFKLEKENEDLRFQVQRQNVISVRNAKEAAQEDSTNKDLDIRNEPHINEDPIQLANSMFKNSRILEKERQKSAVLFTEVVRLGKQVSELQLEQQQSKQEQANRLRKLESVIDQRDGKFETEQIKSRSDLALNKAAAAGLVNKVHSLESELENMNKIIKVEALQRGEMEQAQRNWFEHVKRALIASDVQMTDKLEGAFQQVHSQIHADHSSEMHQRALERADIEGKQQSFRHLLDQEIAGIASQFQKMQERIESEGARREDQIVVLQQFMDRSLQRLQIALGEEEVKRNDALLVYQGEMTSTTAALQGMLQVQTREAREAMSSLEEVLRAEVKARTRHEARDREHVENVAASLAADIQQAKRDVLDKLEELDRSVKLELDATDSSLANLQRDLDVVLEERVERREFVAVKSTCDKLETRIAAEYNAREAKLKSLFDKCDRINDTCIALEKIVSSNHQQHTARENQLDNQLRSEVNEKTQEVATKVQELKELLHDELSATKDNVEAVVNELRSNVNENVDQISGSLETLGAQSKENHDDLVSQVTIHKMVSKVEVDSVSDRLRVLEERVNAELRTLDDETKYIRKEYGDKLTKLAEVAIESEEATAAKINHLDEKLTDQRIDIHSLRKECMRELHEHFIDSLSRDEEVGSYAQKVEVRQVMDRMIFEVVQLNLEKVTVKHDSDIRREQQATEDRYQTLVEQVEKSANQLHAVEARVHAKLEAMDWARKARQREWEQSVAEIENGSADAEDYLHVDEAPVNKSEAPGSPMGPNVGPTVVDVGFPLH